MAEEYRALGVGFATQYYNALTDGEKPYAWYFDVSVYSAGVEGAEPPTRAVGRKNITLDADSAFRGSQVNLSVVDCQPSVEDGLVVMVAGTVTSVEKDAEPRSFVQTFFLAKETQEAGFYIRNCILRFLNAPAAPAAPAPSPADPEPVKPVPVKPAPKVVAQVEEAPKVVVEEKAPAPIAAPKAEKAAPAKEAAPASKAPAKAASKKKGERPSFLDAAREGNNHKAEVPKRVNKKPAPKKEAGKKEPNGARPKGPAKDTRVPRTNGTGPHRTNGTGPHRAHGGKPDGRSHINSKAQCYISNIPLDCSDVELRRVLGVFGEVKAMVRPQHRPYGFIEFAKDSDAQKAIQAASLRCIDRDMKIEVRQGKDVRNRGRARPARGKPHSKSR